MTHLLSTEEAKRQIREAVENARRKGGGVRNPKAPETVTSSDLPKDKVSETPFSFQHPRQGRESLVRCCDCIHRHELISNRNALGKSKTDKFCPLPSNGVTLLNGMRSKQSLRAWRKCPSFEWDGEKEA